MSFLKVDKDKAKKKGSIFVAKVDEDKYYVGKNRATDKTSAVLTIAGMCVEGGSLPTIEIVRFKTSSDTYAAEIFLHTRLIEYKGEGEYYLVTANQLSDVWGRL